MKETKTYAYVEINKRIFRTKGEYLTEREKETDTESQRDRERKNIFVKERENFHGILFFSDRTTKRGRGVKLDH